MKKWWLPALGTCAVALAACSQPSVHPERSAVSSETRRAPATDAAPGVPAPEPATSLNTIPAPPPFAAPFDPPEPQLEDSFSLPPWPRALAPSRAPGHCPVHSLPRRADASCADPEAAKERLAAALQLPSPPPGKRSVRCASAWDDDYPEVRSPTAQDVRARDRRLAAVESCTGLEPALVRLTRAALMPECADALAEGALAGEAPRAPIAPALRIALRGHGIAARLDRIRFPPEWQFRGDAKAASEELDRLYAPWIRAQYERFRGVRAAIDALPADTHGRAVAELALADAWERVKHRRIRAPTQIIVDAPKRDAFNDHYRAIIRPILVDAPVIDDDAVLLATNVVADWPVLRRWNSSWPGLGAAEGLKWMVLPPIPARTGEADRDAVLAANLPSYVAARVVPLERMKGVVLRHLILRGFDPALRRGLSSRTDLGQDAELVAHARLMLAARSIEPSHASDALRLLEPLSGSDSVLLMRALADMVARMPPRGAWLVPDAARQVYMGGLDALASRGDVSAATRAMAAHAAYFIAQYGATAPDASPHGERRAAALLKEAGHPLHDCKLTLFIDPEACRCPTVRSF